MIKFLKQLKGNVLLGMILVIPTLFSMESEINENTSLIQNSENFRSDLVIDVFKLLGCKSRQNNPEKSLHLLTRFPEPLLKGVMETFEGTEELFLYYFLPLTGFLTERQAQKIAENIYFNITKASNSVAGWQNIWKTVHRTLLLSAKNKLKEDGQKRLRIARKLIFDLLDKQEEQFKCLDSIKGLIKFKESYYIGSALLGCCGKSYEDFSYLELKKLFIEAKFSFLLHSRSIQMRRNSNLWKPCFIFTIVAPIMFILSAFGWNLVEVRYGDIDTSIRNILAFLLCVCCCALGGATSLVYLFCSFIMDVSHWESEWSLNDLKIIKKALLRRKKELLENKFVNVNDKIAI